LTTATNGEVGFEHELSKCVSIEVFKNPHTSFLGRQFVEMFSTGMRGPHDDIEFELGKVPHNPCARPLGEIFGVTATKRDQDTLEFRSFLRFTTQFGKGGS